jgi:DNA topoisomerase-3
MFEGIISEKGSVTVVDTSESEKRLTRPLPLNTVELLKIASKALGMSPSFTMSVAERLYLSGYVGSALQCSR